MIMQQTGKQSLGMLLDICRQCKMDAGRIGQIAKQTLRYLAGTSKARVQSRPNQELERRWYKSIDAGQPDYAVYESEDYLGDLWACWQTYSRKYLHSLAKIDIGSPSRIADIGCGIGFTTAAMREIYPDTEVVATNIGESPQVSVAREMSDRHGFTLLKDLSDVGPVDVVFASEYFEHFADPLEHLTDVLRELSPSTLVCANSFCTSSIGHFREHQGMNGRQTSKAFAAALRRSKYTRVETAFWNNRPAVWVQKNPGG